MRDLHSQERKCLPQRPWNCLLPAASVRHWPGKQHACTMLWHVARGVIHGVHSVSYPLHSYGCCACHDSMLDIPVLPYDCLADCYYDFCRPDRESTAAVQQPKKLKNVYARANGRWQASVIIQGQRHCSYHDSAEAASSAADAFRQQHGKPVRKRSSKSGRPQCTEPFDQLSGVSCLRSESCDMFANM